MADRDGLSPGARRARALFRAGGLGGVVLAVLVVLAFLFLRGPDAGLSALVAAAVTLGFLGLGQWVQVRMADAPPVTMMMAWLVSYLLRVGVPGIFLVVAMARPEYVATMDRTAVAASTVAAVVGWLAAEIRAYSRLRIPVFDQTDDTGG